MAVVLTVRERAWRTHLQVTAVSLPGLIPVVKGNGYGFGRRFLAAEAVALGELHEPEDPLGSCIAVGTVHEAREVPSERSPLALTPEMGSLPTDLPAATVLTVGSLRHVEHLTREGWHGRVVLKLRSSMRRYGCDPEELMHLHRAVEAAGLSGCAYSIHPALHGTDAEHVADIERWLPHLDPALTVAVSHLDPATYHQLRARHPDRRFAIRCGTRLWHGDKSMLHLGAIVNDVRAARAGDIAGYRGSTVPADGQLVMIGAGSAHGVVPLPDGRSPFHFARQRLELLEPPHMHTSMAAVPEGQPCPAPGDLVDVQRPLTQTLADTIAWLP